MDTKNISSYVLLEKIRRNGTNVWTEETSMYLAKIKNIGYAEARRVKMEWIKDYAQIEEYLESQKLIEPRQDGWKPDIFDVAKNRTSTILPVRRKCLKTVKAFKMSDKIAQSLNADKKNANNKADSSDSSLER